MINTKQPDEPLKWSAPTDSNEPLISSSAADDDATTEQRTQKSRAQIERHTRWWKGSTNCCLIASFHQAPLAVRLVLLPLLLIFLLPTIRLDRTVNKALITLPPPPSKPETNLVTQLLFGLHNQGLVESLLRLPLDRLRLEAAFVAGASAAKPEVVQVAKVAKKVGGDLQEEETHMLMLAPAEHRARNYHYANGPDGGVATVGPASGAGPADQAEYGGGGGGGPEVADHAGAGEATIVSETGGQGTSGLQARADLPAVRALNVKCEKNHMTVNIVFDRPFYGLVFSKGHYNDQKCVHLAPNSGQTSINFDIHLGKCGMSSSDAGPPTSASSSTAIAQQSNGQQQQQQQPNGVYIENTIIIQYDPLVQEIYDQARKLRCTWYDYYEKSVTFRPYNVDMLDAVTANFLGDNIQCWMQIQVGKGPWSSEVAGIVKIGQTMTMVLAIKDDENRFDMLVRNCVAHDGKHQPIQLVDEYGCVARPKIMGKFQKVRNFGPAATVVSYAHFQAFKFPDSMSVHFQCVIQVCRFECPEPVCNNQQAGGEIAASNSVGGAPPGSGVNQPQGDYATSGTEMVASKEPAGHLMTQYQNHSAAHGSQNVQLKLDESLGRVQVKLDTSMMAGVTSPARPHQQPPGPLPPHLLHMAAGSGQEQQTNNNRAYLSSSYYRPQTAGTSGQTAGGRPMAMVPASVGGGRAAHLMAAAPPGGAHSHSYSTQFNGAQSVAASRRSATFANRLGELPAEQLVGVADSTLDRNHHQLAPPYEAEYPPLSLIALPRGLKLGAGTRVKRESGSGSGSAAPPTQSERHARHLRGGDSSTSVQTQKTIQVVSPDDVAFSLLSEQPNEEQPTSGGDARWRNRQHIDTTATSVCFSTARLMWGLVVTLAALASSIVIATYVILKQRSQLDRKLSSVFVGGTSGSDHSDLYNDTPPPPTHFDATDHLHQQQQILTSQQQHNNHLNNSAYCTRAAISHQQRQQEELEQRNTYLSRLYSQFAPANYWR